MKIDQIKVAVIGLGYVGLPLAVEFSKKYFTIGFDIDPARIKEINKYDNKTDEISTDDLKSVIKFENSLEKNHRNT